MPKRDVFTWTAKISLFTKGAHKERAIHEYKSMLQHDVRPNYVTMLCVINAACALESDDLKRGIHSTAIKFGFGLDPFVVTALLGVYSCLGETYDAWKLFCEVAIKDLVLWTAMVSVFSNNSLYIEAIDTFRNMRRCGLWPNDVSILSVLPARGNSDAVVPVVGRVFSSEDEIHNYYYKYAYQVGFEVVTKSTRKENGLQCLSLCCSRYRKYESSSSNYRPTKAANCPAKMNVKVSRKGKYEISKVVLDHEHAVSPEKFRRFRSNKTISMQERRTLETNDAIGIRMNKSYSSMVHEAGGHEYMTLERTRLEHTFGRRDWNLESVMQKHFNNI